MRFSLSFLTKKKEEERSERYFGLSQLYLIQFIQAFHYLHNNNNNNEFVLKMNF
jgi:hypothetical protein